VLTFPAATIIKATTKGIYDDQLVENVYALRVVGSSITAEDLCVSIRDVIVRRWSIRQMAEHVVNSIIVQGLFPTLTDPYEKPIGEAGAQEGDGLPQLNAVVVSIKTGLGGRANRGRKYLSGVPAGDEDKGRLTSARLADWQSKADAIWSDAHSGGGVGTWEIGILHRSSGGAPVPIGAGSFVPATQLVVQSILGTMRSRKPGHGA
jgi:hypothetical protein